MTDFFIKLTKYQEIVFTKRGEMIHACINLEYGMDTFITHYFCDDGNKWFDFINQIFWKPQTGLTRKCEIVSFIISEKKQDFLKAYPNILTDLPKIIKCRNILAHQFIDHKGFYSRSEKGQYRFTSKKGLKIDYDEKSITELRDLANSYAAALMYAHGFLPLNFG